MSDTSSPDPNQSSAQSQSSNNPYSNPGSASSAPPSPPNPNPSGNPAGAQATPRKSGGVLGAIGNFFSGIGDDWRKNQDLKRELKRAKAAPSQNQQPTQTASETDEDNAGSSNDILQQERMKRIRMISEFADVKETLDHKVKRWIAAAACTIVPWALVLFMTSDVGEYFAGRPFTTADFQIVGIFGITALLEIVIAVVTNAWGNTVHDMNATESAGDKMKLQERARVQGIAWAVLSAVSGFALFMFLMQRNADNIAIANHTLTVAQVGEGLHVQVDYVFNAAMINIVLRVVGTLAIDPACVFAVHVTSKNLDQFLKQQNAITTGITQVSDAIDKQQEAAARASMRQKENERFLELKSGMDTVNAQMMAKMGDKLLQMSDQMFEHMHLPAGRIVNADEDDDDGRNVRRLRR